MKRGLSLFVAMLFLLPFYLSLGPLRATDLATDFSDKCTIKPSEIPHTLRVPPGHEELLRALAYGVQIYLCQATPAGHQWVFRAPEADLFNEDGEEIGIHYAGPTWEASDGSLVVGQVMAMANAPDPDAIPWLLLRAVAHDGDGTFSEVTYIQRLETGGGRAPAHGCDASHVGAEARVDYSACYYFYVEER